MWHPDIEVHLELPDIEGTPCENCFKSLSHMQPLSMVDFDIKKECFLVLLYWSRLCMAPLQTLYKKQDMGRRTDFLLKKLTKLYEIYHNTLRVYNKNHVGIMQQANTTNLLIDYHSIK